MYTKNYSIFFQMTNKFFQSVHKKIYILKNNNKKKILNIKCINKKLPFVEYNWSVSLAGKMTDF